MPSNRGKSSATGALKLSASNLFCVILTVPLDAASVKQLGGYATAAAGMTTSAKTMLRRVIATTMAYCPATVSSTTGAAITGTLRTGGTLPASNPTATRTCLSVGQ